MRVAVTIAALLSAICFGYLSFRSLIAAEDPAEVEASPQTRRSELERIRAHCDKVIRGVEDETTLLMPLALETADKVYSLEEFVQLSPEKRANLKTSTIRVPVALATVRQRLTAAKVSPESIDSFIRDELEISRSNLGVWKNRRQAVAQQLADLGRIPPGVKILPIKEEDKKPDEPSIEGKKGTDDKKPEEPRYDDKKPREPAKEPPITDLLNRPDEKKPDEKRPEPNREEKMPDVKKPEPYREEKKPDVKKPEPYREDKSPEKKPEPISEEKQRDLRLFVGKWQLVEKNFSGQNVKIPQDQGVRIWTNASGDFYISSGRQLNQRSPGIPFRMLPDASPKRIDIAQPGYVLGANYRLDEKSLTIVFPDRRAKSRKVAPDSFKEQDGVGILYFQRLDDVEKDWESRIDANAIPESIFDVDPYSSALTPRGIAEAGKFVGRWKLVERNVDGQDLALKDNEELEFIFSDRLLYTRPIRKPAYVPTPVVVDPTKSPRRIDLLHYGMEVHSIYRFEGNRLRICNFSPLLRPEGDRPTDFQPADKIVVAVFERVGEEEAGPPPTEPLVAKEETPPRRAANDQDPIVFTYTDGINAKPGTIEQLNKTTWIETTPKGTLYRYRETSRNKEFIELHDANREVSLRIYRTKVMLRHPMLTAGDWQDWRQLQDQEEKSPNAATIPEKEDVDKTEVEKKEVEKKEVERKEMKE